MADYDWGKACCGQIVGHKDNCPEHPILGELAVERRRKRMADYSDAYAGTRYGRDEPVRVSKSKLATEAVDEPVTENTLSDYEQGRLAGYEEGFAEAKAQALLAIVKAVTAV